MWTFRVEILKSCLAGSVYFSSHVLQQNRVVGLLFEILVNNINKMSLEILVNNINSSFFINGLSVLVMNLGGKYLAEDLKSSHDYYFRTPFMRVIFVFAGIFVATRNFVLSLTLTLIYYVVVKMLLDTSSVFCVIPKEAYKNFK